MRELNLSETKNVNGGALFLVPAAIGLFEAGSAGAFAAGAITHLAVRGAAVYGAYRFLGRN